MTSRIPTPALAISIRLISFLMAEPSRYEVAVAGPTPTTCGKYTPVGQLDSDQQIAQQWGI
jgi:hypothetical protein